MKEEGARDYLEWGPNRAWIGYDHSRGDKGRDRLLAAAN